MAKPNYAFEKRQRDLMKQRKKEEKRQRKADKQIASGASNAGQERAPGDPESAETTASGTEQPE